MNKGLLVRVAIDSTSGGWNGPCDEKEFCYVPMGSSRNLTMSYDRAYEPYRRAVEAFLPCSVNRRCRWPRRLPLVGHFDPDFEHLSFGDGGKRGDRIVSNLAKGDCIVFYAGLRSVDTGSLVYSIIGFYVIDRVLFGRDVPQEDWHRNAHTRDGGCKDGGDIVVFAKHCVSGRLLHHIPIGSYREGAWRVRQDLLEEWGGLDVRNGYIQRSVHLPMFKDSSRFKQWFDRQNPVLLQSDNPECTQTERLPSRSSGRDQG